MAQTELRGNVINLVGELPAVGSKAPAFELVRKDLSPLRSDELAGQRVILNISPSIDTGTCATSVRVFNERATQLDNTTVVYVSNDLPQAHNRFCGAEGIDNVITGSGFRSSFGDDYGVKMVDGPLAALLARAIVVLDTDGTVLHTQLVADIPLEPDYDSAIAALG